MNLQELLRKGTLERVAQDRKSAEQLLDSAEHNIDVAEDNLVRTHHGWALAIAYNAMLSAGRALMAARGYRAAGEGHHLAVVQFCAAVVRTESDALVGAFNRYRIRRHNVVYGQAASVSEGEAKGAVTNAKEFVNKIKGMCKV